MGRVRAVLSYVMIIPQQPPLFLTGRNNARCWSQSWKMQHAANLCNVIIVNQDQQVLSLEDSFRNSSRCNALELRQQYHRKKSKLPVDALKKGGFSSHHLPHAPGITHQKAPENWRSQYQTMLKRRFHLQFRRIYPSRGLPGPVTSFSPPMFVVVTW
jgi:hypothetical protein